MESTCLFDSENSRNNGFKVLKRKEIFGKSKTGAQMIRDGEVTRCGYQMLKGTTWLIQRTKATRGRTS